MKRPIAFVATAMLFAFGACSDTQATDSQTNEPAGAVAPTADQVRVSIELPGMD